MIKNIKNYICKNKDYFDERSQLSYSDPYIDAYAYYLTYYFHQVVDCVYDKETHDYYYIVLGQLNLVNKDTFQLYPAEQYGKYPDTVYTIVPLSLISHKLPKGYDWVSNLTIDIK